MIHVLLAKVDLIEKTKDYTYNYDQHTYIYIYISVRMLCCKCTKCFSMYLFKYPPIVVFLLVPDHVYKYSRQIQKQFF